MPGPIMTPAEVRADIAERIYGLDQDGTAMLRRVAEFMIGTAVDVLEAPPAERAALYQTARAKSAAFGIDLRNMPESYDQATETFLRGVWYVAGHTEMVTRGDLPTH